MTKANKIIIFGGDQRTVHMIQQFAGFGLEVIVVGFDNMHFNHENITHEMVKDSIFQKAKAVILPVGGTDERGEVVASFTTDKLILTHSNIEQLPSNAVVYTGIAKHYLVDLLEKHHIHYNILFNRNDVAILNSVPTAEGTLQIAMEQTNHTIHQSEVVIVGFGRIGITMARLFKAVGAKTTVVTRNADEKARIIEMGCSLLSFESLEKHMHTFDICINTVPSLIVTKHVIDQMSAQSLIIDVASAPGGVDFSYAKQSGIQAVHALGIPGKTAPITAGHILADILIDLISDQS